jgi:hypothetical protein
VANHVPGDGATCLLDVPTHKTGTSYAKPVGPVLDRRTASSCAMDDLLGRAPRNHERQHGSLVDSADLTSPRHLLSRVPQTVTGPPT